VIRPKGQAQSDFPEGIHSVQDNGVLGVFALQEGSGPFFIEKGPPF
jgi:hypothetical protein